MQHDEHIKGSGRLPMREHLEPATTIIASFNSEDKRDGARRLSQGIGVSASRIKYWRLPKECGGTDGAIPRKHHWKIKDFGAKLGKTFTDADLFGVNLDR